VYDVIMHALRLITHTSDSCLMLDHVRL